MLLTNSVTGQQVGNVTHRGAASPTRSPTGRRSRSRTPASRSTSAINGDGFFAVRTAQGTRYTRNGEFTADEQGRLTTMEGGLVLGRNNQPLTLGADGKVDPRLLNVVLLNTPEKVGDNYVTGTPTAGTAGQVRAGALEGSGADPTQSMVDMMASMRAYESGQKVIQTIDETLGKAASAVGSLQLNAEPSPI